jgi:hypothetical protein
MLMASVTPDDRLSVRVETVRESLVWMGLL